MEDLRASTTIFCGVLAFAIALSMLLRGRRSVHLLFAAFATCLAFWYTSQSLAGFFQSAVWVRVTAILTVLLPQFAVHLFQAILPRERESAPSRLPRDAAVLGVPMLAIALSPYHQAPFALGLAYFYVFGLLAAALISLWRRGRRSKSRAARERVKFLVGVGALATVFTLGDFLSYLKVYLPPIGAVLSIVFLFVLAESLARPRLADMYEMSGRLLVSTALAFCLAGIFHVFVTYIGRFQTMYLNAVLAAIVFLVLFEPLQQAVETRIHQFLFRERYDLETSVASMRRRLAHVFDMDEMVEMLLAGLEGSRHVTSAGVYLRDADGDGFDCAGAIGAPAPKRIESLPMLPLLDALQKSGSLCLEELAREPDAAPIMASAGSLGPFQTGVLLAVRAEDGELVGIMCVADDRLRDSFTPEEIVLLEALAAQIGVTMANTRAYTRIKEKDRLAALGAMAAGLAHEVKNPLGAIKGAAQLLEELETEKPTKDGTSHEFIGVIIEEVNRLDRVVKSFLDYARPHAGNPVPLDINAAVRRTVQILSNQTGDVDLQLELTEPLPRARIDAEQFRQVLINLVQNAIQAMDGHGRVTVTTSQRRHTRNTWSTSAQGGERASTGASRTDDDFVEVSVRDTGPGIPQKVLRNLFIPFFTTKEQGTGLGLAISQSLVQNAGGAIDVQTQSGTGTKFTIVLPAAVGLNTPALQPEETQAERVRA